MKIVLRLLRLITHAQNLWCAQDIRLTPFWLTAISPSMLLMTTACGHERTK